MKSPQESINFRCAACSRDFEAAPSTVHEQPEQEHHPYRYEGTCPKCGTTCPQAKWELGLFKAWMNATGPKTEAGKAATAKNLEGHPTPEEALRTRFNGMKHGMHARVATYFPARPDKYSFCEGCDVDRTWCAAQPACAKQTEIFMLHHAAFEQRDPKHLRGIYADMQATLTAILQTIMRTILADGVKLTAPKFYTDKEGNLNRVEFMNVETGQYEPVLEINQHPLFKALGDLLSKNNLSLADMGITQRVAEREEEELGHLSAPGAGPKRELLEDVAYRNAVALENLSAALERSRTQRARDPVLIEHDAQEGGRS